MANKNAAKNANTYRQKKRNKKDIDATNERIAIEESRLWELITDAPEPTLNKVVVLVQQLAVMRINLEDLSKHVIEYGQSEIMQNGSQIMRKETPESKNLDSTRKTYIATLKQLESMLPSEVVIPLEDDFDLFEKSRPSR